MFWEASEEHLQMRLISGSCRLKQIINNIIEGRKKK